MTLTLAELQWEEEQKNIAILKRKWPRAIRDHTKRPNEAWRGGENEVKQAKLSSYMERPEDHMNAIEPATGSTSFVLICCDDARPTIDKAVAI